MIAAIKTFKSFSTSIRQLLHHHEMILEGKIPSLSSHYPNPIIDYNYFDCYLVSRYNSRHYLSNYHMIYVWEDAELNFDTHTPRKLHIKKKKDEPVFLNTL